MTQSVSVIMTCHNESAFIEQAVLSAARQTASHAIMEIVVVNDGSSDDSQEVLEALRLDVPLLRIIKTDGVGLPAARNLAIAATSGSIIAILDGDDYWAADKIERQLPALGDPRVGIVYSDWHDVDVRQGSIAKLVTARRYEASSEDTLSRYFVYDAPIMPSTALIRRAVFDDVGLFDPEVRWGEDTEMFLRVAERWRFQHVPGGLLYKRAHGGNITSNLERLLPVHKMLTDRFIGRNPELARFRRRRLGRRYAVVGNNCASRGELGKAYGYFASALRNDPLQMRTWAYVALAAIPGGVSGRLRNRIKELIHGRKAATTAQEKVR